MVACARPHDSDSRNSQPLANGSDSTSENGLHEEDDPSLMPTDNMADDEGGGQPWPEAEGYTPLTDIMFAQQGSALMALPPSSMDGDDSDSGILSAGHSAFMADPSALVGNSSMQDSNGIDNDSCPREQVFHGHNETQPDFRNVASLALSALEEDYHMTLQGDIPPSTQTQSPCLSLPSPSEPELESNAANIEQDAPDSNFANFESLAITTASTEPSIDVDAVKRAVAGIVQNTSGSIGDKFMTWQQERKNRHTTKEYKDTSQAETSRISRQYRHSLIPTASLKAFTKDTPKAIQATVNLTRAATIAEALERCSSLLHAQDFLSIHIVGADHVECASQDKIRALLQPLAQWIGGNAYAPRHLSIVLMGPNVSDEAESWPAINLLSAANSDGGHHHYQRLLSATAKCYHGKYHDWMSNSEDQADEDGPSRNRCRSDLVVCFNAGIWGYDDWKPTIRYLVQQSTTTTLICTSYTIQEAEDDYDVILEEILSGLISAPSSSSGDANEDSKHATVRKRCIWEPQINPFASRKKRDTATAVEGREYRENAAWQAWRL